MARRALLLPVVVLFQIGLAAGQGPLPLTGIVTDTGTPAEFTMETTRVQCTAATGLIIEQDGKPGTPLPACPSWSMGEKLIVYGEKDRKTGVLTARSIEIDRPGDGNVEGPAVIDRIITPADAAGNITVSADGYTILIPGTIHPAFEEPLTNQTPVTTNLWLRYSGTRDDDGIITAKTVVYAQNILKGREQKANEKREFDPSSVTEKDRQSKLSIAFMGVDPKRFPAVHDPQMQTRVETIGQRLIPAYQRELPASDPSKINFRFQVVDQPKMHDALTLSNGIILIPKHIVERLPDDAQLATVLADNIACALEKQELRLIPTRRTEAASNVAITVAGAFVPGLGIAGVATGVSEHVIQRRDEEQSGRVSLVLLQQAGFDIRKAPATWWILAAKNKPLDHVSMPIRARYLYQMLGTVWRAPAPAPSPLSSAAE